MKATVGTASYSTSNCIAVSQSSTLFIDGLISLTSVTYPYMSLEINNWNGATGAITIDGLTNIAGYNTSATEISQSGTVNITSVSSTAISGTFSFTCTDSTKVTNGTFTAKRQ